ncbi:MAG: response regulator [Elusimicrobia bacterium]|nr:response regulator [Elusimicrobiota bacterium]
MAETKKVLVVDDNSSFRELIEYTFRDSGFQIISACNGKQGIEKAILEKPDIILLDVMMPDFSGIEVVRTLSSKAIKIPIIVLTGTHFNSTMESLFKEEGVDKFLSKMTPIEEIICQVKKML